ncbi:hypothetical protein MHK_000365, partial [Candidatus Magnetomorum sp. HK-1]
MKIGSMKAFNKNVPKKILNDDEFLPDHLKTIRNYVYKNHKRDISFPLYVYENRVEFYENFVPEIDKPISWETIRTFEVETKKGTYTYQIDRRLIKLYFLIGWLEVKMYKRGRIYFQDDIDNFFDLNCYDQFIQGIKLHKP